jgi:fibronectin-binding autotransporter adhesin
MRSNSRTKNNEAAVRSIPTPATVPSDTHTTVAMRRRAAVLVAAAGLTFAAPAFGQLVWNNNVGGNWSNPLKWTPNNVPDNASESAALSAAGAYAVILDNTYSIAALSIPVNTVQLDIVDARELGISSGGINNNGIIRVNSSAGANGTGIRLIGGGISLIGSGSILLNASGNLATAYLTTNSGAWIITQGPTHTIRGTGSIDAGLANEGTVNADQNGKILRLASQPKSNNALLTATGGGVLDVASTVNNGPSGRIDANAGVVQFASATINNGTINTLAGGATRITATSTFSNVTTTGLFEILDTREMSLAGSTLTNNGTIAINNGSGANGTGIRLVGGGLTLNGTGSILLNATSNLATAYLTTNSGSWSLTQAESHTIRGTGSVDLPLVNNGTVNADQTGKALRVTANPKTNNRLFTATNDAFLDLNTAITQSASGEIVANNGRVRLSGASISGGQFRTQGTGVIEITGTTGINNVTNSGTVQQADNTQTQLGTTGLVNNATWTINTGSGGNAASITLTGGPSTISGFGSVLLNATSNLDTAIVGSNSGNWPLTQALGHRIRGTGSISAPLTNNGVVNADQSGKVLRITSNPKINNNLFSATNGGILDINGAVSQGPSGQIVADTGTVRMSGASITGGQLTTFTGGTMLVTGTSTFNNVTNQGVVQQADNTTAQLGSTGLINNGTWTINTGIGTNATLINLVDGPSTITGSGSIVLNATTNRDTSYINSNAGTWPLTHAANHTIRGTGRIYAPMSNDGTVTADVPGRMLELISQPKTNNNVMRAINAGILGVNCSLSQTANGRLVADGAPVQLFGATITGGRLEATGNGRVQVVSTTMFSGVTNAAPVDIFDNVILSVPAAGFVNNGTVTVNSSGGANATSILLIGGPAAITGTGTILLNANSNLDTAFLNSNSGSWPLTLGSGQTLTGTGRCYAPTILQGTISPGIGTAVGRIEPRQVFTFAPTSAADIQIASVSAADVIASNNPITINGGSLTVSAINGFIGGIGQSWTVISGSSRTGQFAQVQLPSPPQAGLKWAVQYTSNSVIVRVTCNSDYNGDGQVDFFDYLDFVSDFSVEAPDADFNGDNTIDFFDYLDFVNEYARGCE